MALVLKDRVKETSTTAGTGTITLAGAVAGFQSFSAVGNGNTTYYAIVDSTTGDWEVGIGTYTSSGTTLSRTTVLSSSNGGSLVPFAANPKDVFVTYPSEKSVYEDASNVVNATLFGAITATSAALTTGTVSTTPASNTDIANKQYVDGLVTQGISYHEPVYVESPNTAGNLNALYNQPGGAGNGVGATLTNNGTKAALTIDGVLMTTTKRVLVYNQTNAFENGVYTVTTVGTPDPGGTNWVLTRSTDADTYGLRDPNALGYNDAFFVTNGDTGAGETYVCTTTGVITFGSTNITFAQISSAQVYNAGTGLNLSPATTFNISNTGVTANTYGSASAVPVFAVNAQGQLTSVTNTNIAINGSQVSGNISGQAGSVANALTLGTYLTGGTYNGSAAVTATVDATSANTASKVVARDSSGNFSAGTITATLNGSATSTTTATNLSGGAANQIAYQSGSGTTTFATAPSASNQVLNWNGSAFTWSAGTISGVPLGSNLNSLTAGTYLTGTAYNGSAAQTWTVDATDANTASKVVARDASGNFSASTITAALSGNATSATNSTTTSQTNFSNLTIGGSQVLYAGNYNSYAPTLTGTGASGTWGINITGNAATATSATSATSSTYTTYISNISLGTGSANVNYGSSAVLRIDGGSGAALQYAPIFHAAAGDTMWQAQGSYGSSGDGTLYFRQGYFGSWGNWLTMLSSANYNSYAPTLTGTGASGTWSINVTGSAGSAGSVDFANLTNKASGTGTYTTSGDYRAPIFYDSNNTAYYVDPAGTTSGSFFGFVGIGNNYGTDDGGWGSRLNVGGTNYGRIDARCAVDGIVTTMYSHAGQGLGKVGTMSNHPLALMAQEGSIGGYVYNGSMRAPIFYDSDNTNYYLDPASTSELNKVYYNSNMVSRNYGIGQVGLYESTKYQAVFSMGESYILPANGTTTGNLYGIAWSHPNAGGAAANLASHGILMLENGGFQGAWGGGSLRTPSDVRGTIFYDYSNTGYYVDPASTSNLNTTYISSHFYTSYNSSNPTIRVAGASSAGLLLQDNSSAFMLQLYGVGNTYGFLNAAWAGWDLRKVNGGALYLSGQNTYFYDSTETYMNRVYGATDIRSPIYYDLNNTGYYLDMNGSSNVSTTVTGNMYFMSNFNTASGSSAPLQAYSSGGSGAVMSFHRGGYYAINFGLDSDNVMRLGGWSASANLLQIDMSGNLTMLANVTAYSDERLKKDWDDLPSDFVPRLARVKSGTYTRIDNEMRQIGVGAQSLRPLMEEAVFENADGTLSVAYGNAAMASSVELARYVTALEQRISQLEARI